MYRKSNVARIVLSLATCTGLVCSAVGPVGATPVDSAPSTSAPISTGPDHTSRAFFSQMLTRLKLPVTEANLDALYAVEHREGDNDRYNPLNVVQPEPGSTSYNSVGVQRYASFATGLDGTVHLLSNGHWTGVRHALKGGRSTAAVLAAFSGAYTWDSGITFQTGRALLDAEAVRDVGGRYADPQLAAARARERQAGLKKALAAPMATFTAAAATSARAHRDHAARSTKYAAVLAALQAQTQVAAARAERARVDHATVVQVITAQYLNNGSGGSVDHLLASHSVSDYLDSQALQGYVTSGQDRLFHRYLAEQRTADAAEAVVARTTATAVALRKGMQADIATWTSADARAATARTTLLGLLRPAQRDSIVAPVVQDALHTMRAARD